MTNAVFFFFFFFFIAREHGVEGIWTSGIVSRSGSGRTFVRSVDARKPGNSFVE